MPQVSGQLQVTHGPAGFTYVFAGVTVMYMTAIGLEVWFFGREARQEAQLALQQS